MEEALKHVLTAVAGGVEMANDRLGGPLRIQGWTSNVSERLNSGELDGPLKQVAQKYSDRLTTTAGPEMQLVAGLMVSLGAWHATQSLKTHDDVEVKPRRRDVQPRVIDDDDEAAMYHRPRSRIKWPPLDGSWEHLCEDPMRLRPHHTLL